MSNRSNYACVIINPVAGGGSTRQKWPDIASRLKSQGIRYDSEMTTHPGHAVELARKAAGDGYEFVVAVGGDGTVNEVANGILSSKASQNTTLGIINTGTGSDYIRTVETPRDCLEACNFLERRDRFLADVGHVEYFEGGKEAGRFFVNYAGVGFDAEVAEETNSMPKKFSGSTVPYVLALLRTLWSYRNKTVKLAIDGEVHQTKILTLICANGKYFGGGMKVAPDASLTDGEMDVVIVWDIGKFELLRAFPRIYKGTHVTHPKVSISLASLVEVESVERMLVSADGELLGQAPAVFKIVPKALAVAR